mmetsp:Transcript_5412/g.9660  ORF Transcript_5412/g.9660 Transcript_5412/m.9660 type:complete len:216 (-) Transcript_5412:195-842(-)
MTQVTGRRRGTSLFSSLDWEGTAVVSFSSLGCLGLVVFVCLAGGGAALAAASFFCLGSSAAVVSFSSLGCLGLVVFGFLAGGGAALVAASLFCLGSLGLVVLVFFAGGGAALVEASSANLLAISLLAVVWPRCVAISRAMCGSGFGLAGKLSVSPLMAIGEVRIPCSHGGPWLPCPSCLGSSGLVLVPLGFFAAGVGAAPAVAFFSCLGFLGLAT